ncbi:MAG TPA: hypothetical protein EYQ08_00805 [Planctomycetes bacterium]|nr:hypothetical protein [Planctomycetota bacterium]HIK82060.1 hypothetical protein [Planctomycetota bacterium]
MGQQDGSPVAKWLCWLLVVVTLTSGWSIGSAQQGNLEGDLAGNLDGESGGQRMRDVQIGGYLDLELFIDSNRFDFRNHRLVPMLDAVVTEHVHFSCEIEFEYGGPQVATADGEVKVEYAHVDVDLGGWQLRTGAILVPLGSTNLHHDSPIRSLTQRPLVARTVVPTTLTSAGVGALLEGAEGDWLLEIYTLNGFNGGNAIDGYNIDSTSGIRAARPGLKKNGDRSPSLCGRFLWRPELGTEVGLSAWNGSWDSQGELDLTIAVIDVTTEITAGLDTIGPIEVQMEVARVAIELDAPARSAGVPAQLAASSIQLSRRFYPAILEQWFGAESSSGLTLRFEDEDLGGDRRRRSTIGFNIRPSDETIFKFDLEQVMVENQADPDATFICSMATYF